MNMRSQQLASVAACISVIWIFGGCSSAKYGVAHYSRDVAVAFGDSFEIPQKRDVGIPAITVTPLRYNADSNACLFRVDYDGSHKPVEKWVESGGSFRGFPLMESLHLDFMSANETGATVRVYGARPIR